MAINKVFLYGKLTEDIAIHDTKSGAVLGKFTLYVEDTFMKKDGTGYQEKLYAECTLWNQDAQRYSHLQKDSYILVEGRLKAEKWKDKSGVDRFKQIIQVSKIEELASQKLADMPLNEIEEAIMNKDSQQGIDFKDELPF